MSEQPRSVDGRFAEFTRSEPDVRLEERSDDEYNAEGTYEFPPAVRSLDQMVSFWRGVHIPDLILRQMCSKYSEMRVADIQGVLRKWLEDNPKPTSSARLDEWSRRALDYEEQAYQDQPQRIPATSARAVARAALMWRQAAEASGRNQRLDGLQELVESEVMMDMGAAGHVSVGQLLNRYPVDRLDETTWVDRTSEYTEYTALSMDDLLNTLGSETEVAQ